MHVANQISLQQMNRMNTQLLINQRNRRGRNEDVNLSTTDKVILLITAGVAVTGAVFAVYDSMPLGCGSNLDKAVQVLMFAMTGAAVSPLYVPYMIYNFAANLLG